MITVIHPAVKLVIIPFLVPILAACGVLPSNAPKPTTRSTTIVRETYAQTATIPPSIEPTALPMTPTPDPEYVAFESIKTALRTDNHHAPRVVVISSDYHEKGDILVSWVIVGILNDPNLNANVRDDATRIIKAIAQNPFNYTSAVLEAYWPSEDAYGAKSEKLVVNLVYKKSTIDLINWNTFTPDDVYKIADSSFVDPTFQGK
jgi:hypothetical protein